MSCWRKTPPLSNVVSVPDINGSKNIKLKTSSEVIASSPQIKRLKSSFFKSNKTSESVLGSDINKMGNSYSYDLNNLVSDDDVSKSKKLNGTTNCTNNGSSELKNSKIMNFNSLIKTKKNPSLAASNGSIPGDFKKTENFVMEDALGDGSTGISSSSPSSFLTQNGLLNGANTGNVQSKAAAFSRLNSSQHQSQQHQQHAQQRRHLSSATGSSSFHASNESASHKHLKTNLSEMQSSMSRMKALTSQQTMTSSSSSTLNNNSIGKKGIGLSPLKLHNPHTGDYSNDSPLKTGSVVVEELTEFPSDLMSTGVLHQSDLPTSPLSSPNLVMSNHPLMLLPTSTLPPSATPDASGNFHYEEKKTASSSSSMFRSGNYSTEQASANAAQMKRVQTGDVTYEQNSHAAAMKEKTERDGVTAEKKAALLQEQRSLTQGGVTDEESRRAQAASMKLSTDTYVAEKVAAMSERKQTKLAQGKVLKSENHVSGLSQSKLTFKNQSVTQDSDTVIFEDLDSLGWGSPSQDVGKVTDKYATELSSIVENLRGSKEDPENSVNYLNYASDVMKAAWKVPGHGHEVGGSLCKTFKDMGGLDLLIGNFSTMKEDLKIASARLLETSLTPENCNYVVEKGFDCLDKVVKVASEMCIAEESGVGTGLFRHLFRHSESTCSDVLRLQGLERIMAECRRMDVETLRNCAGALVNLSLYGGAENQEAMIKKKVHLWLFPLAFHHDDSIKYYACLAIAVLVANKEIEAQIMKSNTLQLVEPFLTSHNPEEFAASNTSLGQGQSSQWLEKLVPVLSSQREEARSLAAFHFCMEAGIKKRQNSTEIFKQIGAIEPLKRVASSPNALASKLAAQALRLIGETVPHKLSQQVPLWSIEDVREWVIQKGFEEYATSFMASRVDGDLLLKLTEDMLSTDIKMENGILRKRFMRDLWNLKRMADYSSCDTDNLNDFLSSIQPEFCAYTYTLLNNGVDKETLRKCISDEMLAECGVSHSIHRGRILDALRDKSEMSSISEENLDKPLDVFISYRRSNGSQLASLLKVHLALRGFSVFIDVERLEAGKFDNNLLQSITQAKHFVLVLTPDALERCIGDNDCKDWIHREIVAALQSQCNIVPIMDQSFQWPESDKLPEDMQSVHTFNGIKWIHDYQDACVDKIERFLRGEQIPRTDLVSNVSSLNGPNSSQLPLTSGSSTPRVSQQYNRTLSVGSDGRLEEGEKK